jgi:hypothetical protein
MHVTNSLSLQLGRRHGSREHPPNATANHCPTWGGRRVGHRKTRCLTTVLTGGDTLVREWMPSPGSYASILEALAVPTPRTAQHSSDELRTQKGSGAKDALPTLRTPPGPIRWIRVQWISLTGDHEVVCHG